MVAANPINGELMPRIFHQNMRMYGGGSAERNGVFAAGFAAIRAATPPGGYLAAGFTEVLNPGAPLREELFVLAGILDPHLVGFVVIEVGTTAVGAMREFIGIAWDLEALDVQHAGQVFRNPTLKIWEANNVAAGDVAANRTINLPPKLGYGADTRGPAYIAARQGGNRVVIGFMHNMFTLGDKSGPYTNLGGMMDKVRKAIGGAYAGAPVVVGGDFNLPPRPPKRERGEALILETRAARVGGGVAGAYVITSLANPYDYWCVSGGGTDANARVHAETRVVPLGSDHAGISFG
jgi:hypothetical protein